MKVIIQRVRRASVKIDQEAVASINHGLCLLVGIDHNDDEKITEKVAEKIVKLRIFEDQAGKMNLNIKDVQGEILSVSQFTLCANLKKGNRPSFDSAAHPKIAQSLFDLLNHYLSQKQINVQCGVFAAKMEVEIINDGPVTFVIEEI